MKKTFHQKQTAIISKLFGFILVYCLIGFTGLAANVFAQRSYQQDVTMNDFIERLDQNNDSMISMEEFDGPDTLFSELDKNSDGYIDESEKPERPPTGGTDDGKARHFAMLDKNNDGKISLEEFPGPDDHFENFDTDEDGYLDESELPDKPPHRKRGMQDSKRN
jgi:Ca2+-binding EF-hand superfamily protein